MQLIDFPFKGSGHDALAQSFDAIHFGLHQASSVVIAPHFPYPSTQTPACGDCRIAVRKGIARAHALVAGDARDACRGGALGAAAVLAYANSHALDAELWMFKLVALGYMQ